MKRYSFIYYDKTRRLSKLIEYLEEEYKLTFLEIIDLNPTFSITLPYFGIGFARFKKEVMFKSSKKFKESGNRFCPDCNFPIFSENDLEPFKGNEENQKTCKHCIHIVWEDGGFKY